MSISEQSGIGDSMSAVLIPGPPLHPPAMTTVNVNVVITIPTAAWIGYNLSAEYYEDLFSCTVEQETRVATASVDCERRFTVCEEPDGWNVCGWHVWDEHHENVIALFDRHAHASHYADALERKPELVDADD